ncbi:Protein Wnt-11b-2 [Trichinella pseudospiralis]|uniref:Protein Wnt n=1 Tax=Trichinella pseudospiralis TaxID=6337 RepID=A0A0V0XT53_TRIPS|nr:Protein Wnt-11b-2 [Trichinella pseudospiralis]
MFGHTAGMLRWSFLLTIVVILLYSRSTDSIRWLALGQSNKLWNHAQHCPRTRFERKRYGLAGVQTRLCKRHADLMPIIMKSASQSVMICQQQFKNYRWNCSSVRQVPKLPPDLTKGTREQALVYALSAAAVAHGIAKACSSGTIAYCPCGNAVSGAKFDDYIRKGCSDNVPYGQKIINHMLELKCKCHGVSGSCNLKTCWKVLPPLMQKKYSRAAEVRWLSGGNSARYSVEPYALVGRVTEDDLVYIRKSPDYCTEDPRVGSIGTQGRTCNATEQSSAGCDSMCCGRGHEIVFEYVISNCRCRYVHCCYVECDRCRELAEKHPPSELALHSTRRSVRCCRSETTVGLCLFACSPGATATDGSERKNGDEPVAVVYSVRLATTFQRSPLLLPLEGLTPLVLLFSSSATAPVAATLLSRFNSERAEPKHEDGLLFESLK